MAGIRRAVIVSPLRTPVGTFGGSLKGVPDSIKYLPFVPPTRITADLKFPRLGARTRECALGARNVVLHRNAAVRQEGLRSQFHTYRAAVWIGDVRAPGDPYRPFSIRLGEGEIGAYRGQPGQYLERAIAVAPGERIDRAADRHAPPKRPRGRHNRIAIVSA